MSEQPILVTGATGKLGRLVVERLVALGWPVRVFTRRPEAAHTLFGQTVQVAAGDFGDRTSLEAAVCGVGRLLLLSPISARLVTDQIAAADAAIAARVARIVKISGSDWTIEPPGNSISGAAHSAVERHLEGLPMETVSLRPNAWMQVSLANTIRHAITSSQLFAANLDAGIGYIDARDIADVAVHQLLADRLRDRTLNLTGPDVVPFRQIASLIAAALKRPVAALEKPPQSVPENGDFEHRAVAQFARLIAAGHAATTTDVVPMLLGRSPRTVTTFILEQIATAAAVPEYQP
jgi:uncharacterized protein YbjT (DUF2867 family)